MSSEDENPDQKDVAGLIRRELGRESNARFLRSMELFATEDELPEHFRLLLHRLDRAEIRSH